MHIMFMAQHYAPEEVSGAVLAGELATELVSRGHKVSFVTCFPNYPTGRIFSGYSSKPCHTEMISGVRVFRIWSYIHPEKTFARRIFMDGTFSMTSLFGGLLPESPDIIFSYSPPLPLGFSAFLLSRIYNIPWILRVEDIYPDAAIAVGVLQNRFVIGFLKGFEQFLYQKATHISVISEGFRQNLLNKNISSSKISVTPVWADPDQIMPMEKENNFRVKNGLQGKFVIMYAGNLGQTSSMEDILDAAFLLQQDSDIRFVIIGEGIRKNALMDESEKRMLKNILFLPFQPRKHFAETLAAADMGVVTLNPQSSAFSLPSKIFSIMASSRPVLSVSPKNSEIAQLIEKAECGVNIAPGNPEQLAQSVLKLKMKKDVLEKMGNKGRNFLISCFSKKQCIDQYEQLLKEISRCV